MKLIINESQYNAILSEDDNVNDIISLIQNANEHDIDFNDYVKPNNEGNTIQMQIVLNQTQIPIELINFYVSEYQLSDGNTTYQGDIQINPKLRGNNLSYKIFHKFIMEYEQLFFSRYLDRNNKELSIIKKKLGNSSNIGYEIIKDSDGNSEGVLFYKK